MTTIRAFIVEDNRLVASKLVEALSDIATIRVVATAGDEATATAWLTLHHGGCELIIVDIFLATGSGLGVIRAAKEMGAAGTLVVLSNFATPEMRARCLALGATRVFDKSTEVDELFGFCAGLAA